MWRFAFSVTYIYILVTLHLRVAYFQIRYLNTSSIQTYSRNRSYPVGLFYTNWRNLTEFNWRTVSRVFVASTHIYERLAVVFSGSVADENEGAYTGASLSCRKICRNCSLIGFRLFLKWTRIAPFRTEIKFYTLNLWRSRTTSSHSASRPRHSTSNSPYFTGLTSQKR